eukprot:6884437-Pyramimonas_sp.AAC.1
MRLGAHAVLRQRKLWSPAMPQAKRLARGTCQGRLASRPRQWPAGPARSRRGLAEEGHEALPER